MNAHAPNIAEDGRTVVLSDGACLRATASGDGMVWLAHTDRQHGTGSLATVAEARGYATLILEQCRNEELACGLTPAVKGL